MELNKTERDFRKKLQEREILPTENAWDRLDAMLTVAEQNKPKRNNAWLFIAASLIGFICIGIIFFSQTEELIDIRKNEVVNADTITNPTKKTVPNTNRIIIRAVPISQSAVVVLENKPVKLKTKVSSNSNQNQVAYNLKIINEEVTVSSSVEFVYKNDSIAVASINEEPFKFTVNVDAANLLSQVDQELELTFREKVINTIDKNYKKVKVALANRNKK